MTDMEKTLRDRLLNMESPDSMSAKILKESMLEAEGRLSPRKRIENGILAIVGIFFFLIMWIQFHSCRDTLKDVLYLFIFQQQRDVGAEETARLLTGLCGLLLSTLWVALTTAQAITGRHNDLWHPPLKAMGVAGTLFTWAAMLWWNYIVPAMHAFAGRDNDKSLLTVAASVFVLGMMLLVCLGTIVVVYWRVCREGSRMREKMVETQCMVAELGEKMAEKKS